MSIKNQAIQTALAGDWESAIVLNKTLIHEDPQDIDALNRLALAYTITGKVKEAKSAYSKVLKIDPLNPIAIRNAKRLKDKNLAPVTNGATITHNTFLEVPGRTKVVDLVNIAQPKVVEALRTGQSLTLSIKRLKIFAMQDSQYIGVLPDDIARRLSKFIKSGCVYEAYVKCANQHKVTVFIKEIKKSTRFRDQTSFTSISDTPLTLDKGGKFRAQIEKREKESQEEEENEETEEE